MQSLALGWRLLSRAIVSGIHNEFQLKPRAKVKGPVQFVTGCSGFSKSVSKTPNFKNWSFGDDAYFVAKNTSYDVIGVADGVGGWRNYGIDPAAFPRTLMNICERVVVEDRLNLSSPIKVIEASYQELLEQKTPLIGSSTACIVALNREERRLAVAPPSQQGLVLSDSPSMADSSSFPVEEGDVIMLGTDGLFDNLTEDMLLRHISQLQDPQPESVQQTASCIAEEAHLLSFDENYLSPFALSAIDMGIDFIGGKPDDITVVIAKITSFSDSI
ncbi:PPTC7 [Mytilus edulis]|uniref:Protein phosphatase n=1 Tax=Mytilus edulis TaxID=6550 RepID=A0A8S3PQX3_MYTED|nr:PPTC7 [Mytilus edulis]